MTTTPEPAPEPDTRTLSTPEQRTLATADGKQLTATVVHDLTNGRTTYDVTKVGCFTLEPSATDGRVDPDQVQLSYGRHLHPATTYAQDRDYTDRPVIYGVELWGGCVFSAAKLLANPGDAWSWVARRRGAHDSSGGRAPDRTTSKASVIAAALVGDWILDALHGEVLLAHARRRAQGRYNDHARGVTRIEQARTLLAAEGDRHRAAMAKACEYGAQPYELAPGLDRTTREGRAIVGLVYELQQLDGARARGPYGLRTVDQGRLVAALERWLADVGLPLDTYLEDPYRVVNDVGYQRAQRERDTALAGAH